MTTIKNIMVALMLLPLLYACQSEEPVKTEQPKHKITVKAYLPDSEVSRAHISYGNPDVESGEIFLWDEPREGIDPEEIFLYNMTNIKDNPDEARFTLQRINGREAEFEFVGGDGHANSFTCKPEDTILAIYGETNRAKYINDPRKIVTIALGTEGNKPQYITNNPQNDDLLFLRDNLKMYDVVKVEEENVIPELHFKHLSAIMRVTFRNATGKSIYLTKLEFKYPSKTGTESFFNTTLYCSINENANDGFGLIAYDDPVEFYGGSQPYTSNIGTTINGKDGTKDAGESIPDGKSYELYLSTVPRIGNDSYGDEFTTSLIVSHDTDHPYQITLKDFKNPVDSSKVIFTAGKRYWFDLTAVEEEDGTRKLMLTSEWEKLHPNEKAPGK